MCRVTFCCCHSNFRACPCVQHIITFSCNGATYHIDNRKNTNSLSFCFSQCCQCICGFTRLANNHTNIIFMQNGVTVSKFRCQIHLYRNSCIFFNHIFSNNSCVPSTATSNDMNSVNIFHILFCIFNIVQLYFSIYNARTDCFFDCFWLFHDFFHHEIIISTFLRCGNIPSYMIYIFFDFVFIHIQYGNAIFF